MNRRVLITVIVAMSAPYTFARTEAVRAQDPFPEKAFVEAVNAAVDRGLQWVQAQQGPDGGYGTYQFHTDREYPAAQTSLAMLARLASGEAKNSEGIKKGFEYIRANPPQLTYGIGLTLMAYDMRAAPLGERLKLAKMNLAELREYDWPRALEDDERVFLQELVNRLAGESFDGCWSYGAGESAATVEKADASNTQYAVLGLKAGSRMGLEVDHAVLAETLEYFLDHQESSGEKVTYIDLVERSGGEPRRYKKVLKARGWSYAHGDRGGEDVCGSRVNIGIACIVLSLDELLSKAKGGPLRVAKKHKKDAAKAIQGGLAWLDHHFSVTANPPFEDGAAYYYYYMYSLERTGMLTNRRWIGEHDWYRLGAVELIKLQQPDSSWTGNGWENTLVSSCFALLFLRRATIPGPVTRG